MKEATGVDFIIDTIGETIALTISYLCDNTERTMPIAMPEDNPVITRIRVRKVALKKLPEVKISSNATVVSGIEGRRKEWSIMSAAACQMKSQKMIATLVKIIRFVLADIVEFIFWKLHSNCSIESFKRFFHAVAIDI